MILRVAPYFPVWTWSVGGKGIEFMHVTNEALPDMILALERFVLEKRKNSIPFTC